MIPGITLIVLGYAILYWGIHHFPGVDCPGQDPNACRISLVTALGLDRFGIAHGGPFQFKP